jgi:hypothetical protein
MSQVNTELGYSSTATIGLNDTAVRSLAGVPSGTISMSDLWGKSSGPTPQFNNGGEIGGTVNNLTSYGVYIVFNTDGTITYTYFNSLNGSAPTEYCTPTGGGAGNGLEFYLNYATFGLYYGGGTFQAEFNGSGIGPGYNSGWVSLNTQRTIFLSGFAVSGSAGYYQGTMYVRKSDGSGQVGRTWTVNFTLEGD